MASNDEESEDEGEAGVDDEGNEIKKPKANKEKKRWVKKKSGFSIGCCELTAWPNRMTEKPNGWLTERPNKRPHDRTAEQPNEPLTERPNEQLCKRPYNRMNDSPNNQTNGTNDGPNVRTFERPNNQTNAEQMTYCLFAWLIEILRDRSIDQVKNLFLVRITK